MQNIQLSSRIKERCKYRKLPVKLLLEQCEMNRNTIYDLEKKGSFPSSDKLSRIADYLDCSVDYLLGRTDVPEVNHGDNYSQIPHYAQSAASTGRELGKSQSPDDVVEITALQEYEKNK